MMNTLIASPTQAVQKTVSIPASRVRLEGELSLPENATGIVLFAHGSGRASPRNQKVAELIREAGIGTLLFDLLTEAETAQDQSTGSMRFDMSLLSARLVCATQWVLEQPETCELKIGYFGASTGGAAVLMAAAELGDKIAAIVLRGGRPDLAREALGHVTCPTLMIVGGYDEVVYFLNQEAFRQMKCKRALRTVPHASHLFEELGKLEQVANFTADWFLRHMNHAGEEESL